jgi:hypothetical protein
MTWTLSNIRGKREDVKASIAEDKAAPQPVKDFLVSQIDSLAPEVSGCRVDSYCQDLESKADMRVTRIIQMTIVGIKV